jgi:hypothetical protein
VNQLTKGEHRIIREQRAPRLAIQQTAYGPVSVEAHHKSLADDLLGTLPAPGSRRAHWSPAILYSVDEDAKRWHVPGEEPVRDGASTSISDRIDRLTIVIKETGREWQLDLDLNIADPP